jgi:hypothetical protein
MVDLAEEVPGFAISEQMGVDRCASTHAGEVQWQRERELSVCGAHEVVAQ